MKVNNNGQPVTMKSHMHLYFIVVGLFLLIISGSFLTEGMSPIGLENSIKAKNIVDNGFVDFWKPSHIESPTAPDKQSYMPLGYLIESWAMRLFGDSILFDKLYSMFFFVLCAVLIVRIWVLIGNRSRTGWIPLVFWMLSPIVIRSSTQNLLEMPLTVFVLLAFCALVRSYWTRHKSYDLSAITPETPIRKRNFAKAMLWDLLAALWMAAAFLTKGFSGLYMLMMPLVFWVFGRREKVWVPLFETVFILLCWMVGMLIGPLLFPMFRGVVSDYLRFSVIDAGLHEQTVASHLYIVVTLVKQLALGWAAVVIVSLVRLRSNNFKKFFFYWKHEDELDAHEFRNAKMGWRFFWLGMVGVIPIIVTLKQQDFYLISMLPMFAICCGCFVENVTSAGVKNISTKGDRVLSVIAVILVTAGVILNLSSIHSLSQDRTLIADMHEMLPSLKKGEVVSVTPEVAQDPVIADYFLRYKGVTFDTALTHYYLISMFSDITQLNTPTVYRRMELNTQLYHLYRARTPEEVVVDSIADAEAAALQALKDSIKAEELKPKL